jgi:outer membrane immunogenic protein
MAADLPVKAPPPPPAPVYSWTGCYLGINGGWAQAETRVSFAGVDDFSRSADGGAFGGQIGCDYQFASSNWVIGIQALFDGTNIDADRLSVRFPNTAFHAEVEWFGTISARLGYAITPQFLLYGKVGWGTYETSLTAVNTLTGLEIASVSRRQSGLDAGAGAEWMFTQNWSLWVEWDHIFAEDKTVFFPNLGGGSTANVRRDFDKVLVGLNWRFGAAASPVRASY